MEKLFSPPLHLKGLIVSYIRCALSKALSKENTFFRLSSSILGMYNAHVVASFNLELL